MSIGEKIKAAREELGLSQAAVAAAVGASQQTVDRIENGGVTHSRYTTAITTYLDGRREQSGLSRQLDTRSDQYLDLKAGIQVDGFVLDNGQLVSTEQVRAPDTLRHVEDLFSVSLRRGFQGPMGDVVYRPGDRLFLRPNASPRHFDICLIQPDDGRSSQAELRYVLDRIETPGAMDAISEHYTWTDAVGVTFAKVLAVFSR